VVLVDRLVVILVLMPIAVFPAWLYSRNWGYYPSGGVSLILIVLLILRMAPSQKREGWGPV
jgi:hypothetical protein